MVQRQVKRREEVGYDKIVQLEATPGRDDAGVAGSTEAAGAWQDCRSGA
jgi:hypothetical protein